MCLSPLWYREIEGRERKQLDSYPRSPRKLNYLSSTPQTNVKVEGENQIHQVVLCLNICTTAHMHPQTHRVMINKICKEKQGLENWIKPMSGLAAL